MITITPEHLKKMCATMPNQQIAVYHTIDCEKDEQDEKDMKVFSKRVDEILRCRKDFDLYNKLIEEYTSTGLFPILVKDKE